MSSKILTDREVDDPIQQTATFQYNKLDRAYIDEQIRGTQEHVVDNLVSGITGTWYTVSGDSLALGVGDVVCVGGSTPIRYFVTLATPDALLNAGRPIGVCLTAATPNTDVRVALFGVLEPAITGLVPSDNRSVRVSSAGRCETVSSFSTGDFPLGTADSEGYLSLSGSVSTGEGGPLTGDASGHLALTYPAPALANGRATIADLRALTLRAHRSEIHVGEVNRAFRYDTGVGANVADNGYDCIKPTDVLLASNGRWIGLGETEVPTIATLRTLTSGFSSKIFVRGYSDDNDGGEGVFIKRLGSATDNVGTVVVPSGVSTLYYERQYSGALNVKWFGAKGDGTTDDTAAIQAALDNGSGAFGQNVYLPPTDVANNKWYRTTAPLIVRRSIKFFGASGVHRGSSYIRPDAGVGGIEVDNTALGGAAIEDIYCTSDGVSGTVNGLTLRARSHILRCEFGGFGGNGCEIDGGTGNCNGWSITNSTFRNNYGYGVLAHGNEANSGIGTMIDVDANGEAGIADMSFLGNTWVQCTAAENGANHAWLPGISLADPRVSYQTIEPDGSNSGTRNPTFIGCYFEGDNVPLLGPGTTWIGYTDAQRRKLNFDNGTYLLPAYSRNISGSHSIVDNASVLEWAIGRNQPDNTLPEVLFFRDMRRSYGYHFAYDNANIADPQDDMWSMAWAIATYAPFRAFGLSDTNFERGAAKFVFPNGHCVQSEIAEVGGVSKYRFVGPKPLPFLRDVSAFAGLPWQNGDSFEYTTVSAGGYKGRACTRGGFYGDVWQANTSYLVGEYVVASPDNTHAFKCTTAGTSHATTQPTWNTGGGSTTTDGSVTWTEVGQSSIWTEYGYIGTVTGAVSPTWSSLDVTASTTYGFSGADITLTSAISQFSLDISDGEEDLTIDGQQLLNTGATQGNFVEFSRGNDGNASAVPIKKHDGTTIYDLPTGTVGENSSVKLVFTGTAWRLFSQHVAA